MTRTEQETDLVLRREAEWLGHSMVNLPAERLFPLLNVGSSTAQLREHDQPWIDREIFAPLRRRNGRVIHLDMKPDKGVDLVGDLDDPAFFASLGTLGVRSVLCSNVLEHVREPHALARKLVELVPAGGYLVISVPCGFPYHPDPIDTLFRPDVATLTELFPGTRRVMGEEVECGTVFGLLRGNVVRLAAKSSRMVIDNLRGARGVAAREESKRAGGGHLRDWLWPWTVRPFRATCVVLQKL
jgi:hypothetical protein